MIVEANDAFMRVAELFIPEIVQKRDFLRPKLPPEVELAVFLPRWAFTALSVIHAQRMAEHGTQAPMLIEYMRVFPIEDSLRLSPEGLAGLRVYVDDIRTSRSTQAATQAAAENAQKAAEAVKVEKKVNLATLTPTKKKATKKKATKRPKPKLNAARRTKP